MKPYGVQPKYFWGDWDDIKSLGLKSSAAHLKGKNGDIRNSFRNIEQKAKARRYWKRAERQRTKKALYEIMYHCDK
jgi:hypothetical protein